MKLNDFIKVNGTAYSSADEITLADFHLFEMVDVHNIWFSFLGVDSVLQNYSELQRFYDLMKNDERLFL